MRDKQADCPATYCSQCKGEVYHGEHMYKWDGKMVCLDCFKEGVKNWVDDFPDAAAAVIGCQMEEV